LPFFSFRTFIEAVKFYRPTKKPADINREEKKYIQGDLLMACTADQWRNRLTDGTLILGTDEKHIVGTSLAYIWYIFGIF